MVNVKVKVVTSLFLPLFFLFSFLKAQEEQFASCVDFTRGGEKELIRTIGKETKSIIEDIDITIDVNTQSVIDALIPVIYERQESIIDFSDAQTESLTDVIDASTQEVLDALEDFFNEINEITRTVIRHNLSKSGQFVVALIDRPGYYALSGDTTLAIMVDADNVTIDLNEFTISSADPVITVSLGHKNVVIKNGKVKSLGAGGIVVQSDCQLVKIENVTVYFDSLYATEGIFFAGSGNDFIVKDCEVRGFRTGIKAQSLANSTFENCTVFDFQIAGFDLVDSEFCFLDQCRATGALGFQPECAGINAISSSGCVISGCVLTDIANFNSIGLAAGIKLDNCLFFKVIKCVINGVTAPFVGATAYGILVTGDTADLGIDSVFEGNEVIGMEIGVSTGSPDNFFIKNVAYVNTTGYDPIADVGNVYLYDPNGGLINPNTLDNIFAANP